MRYQIIHRMPIKGNTLITVKGDIKPIRIGDSVNGGKSKLLSVAMSDGDALTDKNRTVSLLVSGVFKEEELVY